VISQSWAGAETHLPGGNRKPKGKSHALDYLCCSNHPLAARHRDQYDHGWSHSYPVGYRHHCDPGSSHFGKEATVNKAVSIALLAGGIVLIFIGVNATKSFSSDVSRFFTGSPTDKAVWMLMGGIVAAVIGLFGTTRSSK
jgi:hypothetical protein